MCRSSQTVPESNSPVTSGDHGLDALEPNDEAEEKAADPA